MKKRILCVPSVLPALTLLVILSLVLFSCACAKSAEDTSAASSQPPVSLAVSEEESSEPPHIVPPANGISYTVQNAETPSAAAASVDEPLSVGTWGQAAKFCTENDSYIEVPFRLTAVRRGAAVTEEVRRLTEQGNGYFVEPSQNEEYAIAEYEICLDGFPVGQGGTLCDITAFITGENGEALSLNDGSYWGTTASCLDTSTYYYEGTIHSQMAFRIIKNRSDYLIIAGEYGETQTFFKGQ